MTELRREIVVTITDPSGLAMDVTGRCVRGGLTVRQSLEEDLASLEHSDLSFDLDDFDGAVEAFVGGARPKESWQVRVERESGRRRPKWELLFGGLLDLPQSLQFDRKERRVRVRAYAFTKILSNTSAESIKRTVTGRTGSVTSGTKIVTVAGGTTDLLVGDTIELATSSISEEQVIASVDSGSQVTTVANWGATFATAEVTLKTPYHRNKTIQFLADQLFSAAGITDRTYQLQHELASYPVATELSTDGLPGGLPRSIVDQAGKITITYTTGNRKTATSPTSGFVDGAADTDGQGDWRPYLLNEPGAIVEIAAVPDTGFAAYDHTNGRHYIAAITLTGGPPATGSRIDLRQNGTDVFALDAQISEPSGYINVAQEYEPGEDRVWLSWKRSDASAEQFAYYDVASDTVTNLTGAISDGKGIRFIKPLNLMAVKRGTTLSLYDIPTKAVIRTVTVPERLFLWSIRVLNEHVVAMYDVNNRTRLRVWLADSWLQVADYELSPNSSIVQSIGLMTVFTGEDGKDIGVGFAGNRYFVLAKYFAGVIPYADFEGFSCGAALRELAVVSGAFLEVDEYRIGYLRGRGSIPRGNVVDVGAPSEQEGLLLWDRHRGSVRVRGESEADDAVEFIAGDTGDSAHRESIESRFVTTASMAEIVAGIYAAFYTVERAQENVTVREPESGVVRPMQTVALDGQNYLVLEAETDIESEEQALVLVGV